MTQIRQRTAFAANQRALWLPARISQRSDLQRLRSIYERGNTHMLESENLQRIVNEMRQHARELRKLSHVFAVECRANLARHAAQGSK